MPAAPLPANEIERLAALSALEILDTAPEPSLDALVRAASRLCDTPISLISLIDQDRQWFKANLGLDGVSETPRAEAFCAHAILGADVLVVPDATADPRFADNPLVTGAPDIRFYAGAPLRLASGEAIGTLCVIDHAARRFTVAQAEALRDLSLAAATIIETRLAARRLQHQTSRLAAIVEGTGAATWERNLLTGELRIDERWAELVGKTLADLGPLSQQTWLDHIHPDDAVASDADLAEHLRGARAQHAAEVRLRHRNGDWVWILARGRVITHDQHGRPEWVCGIDIDITEAKRTEAALRDSEAFLHSTGRIAGVGGWRLDLDTNELVWTDETRRIHGVDADYVPDLAAAIAFYAPEARPVIEQAVNHAARTGDPWDLELPLIRTDGERIWVRAVGSAVLEDGVPRRLLGAFQDIDERRRTALALETFAERTRLATAAGHVGIWELTVPDHRFSGDVNACAQFGLPTTMGALGSAGWAQAVHPEDWPRMAERLAACAAGSVPLDGDFRVFWSDGQIRHLRLRAEAVAGPDGMIARLVGTTWDVTEKRRLIDQLADEKRRAEASAQALAERELFLTIITDNLPGKVAYWDRNLRCRFANARYREWFGDRAANVIGMDLRTFLGEALFALNEPYIAGVLAGAAQQFEREVKRADGKIGHMWAQYIPHADHAGAVIGFFVLVTDITPRKIGELLLREANAELVLARDRAHAASQAKTDFLATMSHEIRTPLNAIVGMLQLLAQSGLTGRQTDYVGVADTAARVLLSLINSILDVSRIEARKLTLDPAPFRLDGTLRGIGAIISANLGAKPVEFLFDIDPDLPATIIADEMRLQQVLINLVGNAVKFTESGEIVLSVGLERARGERPRLAVAVRDTGIGISEDKLATIFEMFSQADSSTTRRFGGSGLGLAISQRLVELMGGTITVTSTPGVGSTFSFSMDFEPVAEAAPQPHRLAGLRVLVVSEHAASRGVMSRLASSFGWVVQQAGGEDALALLRARPADPVAFDIILIDWRLSGQDGWAAGEAIRRLPAGQKARLLAMVGGHDREALAEREGRRRSPFDGTVSKPVTGAILAKAVAEALERPHAPDRADGPVDALTATRLRHALAGIRVLLVEDNPVNRHVAQELLERQGALVEAAHDAYAAIAALSEGRSFDVVLMDIQMAGMDGYTATRTIRETLGMTRLPIIAMTANAMAADRAQAFAAGMDDHVAKPFELERLVDAILRQTGRAHPARPGGLPAIGAAIGPAAPDEPPIEPADIAKALASLGGDRRLYGRVVAGLARHVDETLGAAAARLAAGHEEAVRRDLHTLKGLAAMAGAASLASAARAAERAPQARLPGLLEDVRSASARTMAAIAPHLAPDPARHPGPHPGPAAPEPGAAPQAGPPEHGLRQSLLTLGALLRERNMGAVDVFDRLRDDHANAMPNDFARLDEAMECLDFPKAAKLCEALLDRSDLAALRSAPA